MTPDLAHTPQETNFAPGAEVVAAGGNPEAVQEAMNILGGQQVVMHGRGQGRGR